MDWIKIVDQLIIGMGHTPNDYAAAKGFCQQVAPDDFMTIRQAASVLAVCESTVYNWISDGRLNLYKVAGSNSRLRRSEVAALAVPALPDARPCSAGFDLDLPGGGKKLRIGPMTQV